MLNKKKRNSFFLASQSARNPEFSLIITGWGASGKVILQASVQQFFSGTVEKIFGQRWLSPLEKWPIRLYSDAPVWSVGGVLISLSVAVEPVRG